MVFAGRVGMDNRFNKRMCWMEMDCWEFLKQATATRNLADFFLVINRKYDVFSVFKI